MNDVTSDGLDIAVTRAGAAGLTAAHLLPRCHHYTRTLSEWRAAFNDNAERILALGFDRSSVKKMDLTTTSVDSEECRHRDRGRQGEMSG